jgi:large subunit ribosomal protein L19
MALKATHKEMEFGVGDTVKVHQLITEKGKTRTQVFEGMVIGIKGRGVSKTFTVRRVGAAQVGIEKIFPLETPTVQKVEVVKSGVRGTRRAKLYFTRKKSAREIKKIYSRATLKEQSKKAKDKPKPKKATKKTKAKANSSPADNAKPKTKKSTTKSKKATK